MDAPGLSLFQGHTNINLNHDDVQKELEEEDRKEQEQRNKELGNQLMNAFDDLDELDEDDLTVDSSANMISRISENGDIYGHNTSASRNRFTHLDSKGGGDNYSNGYAVNPVLLNGDINFEEKYLDSKFSSVEQLTILYEVRVREVQNLTTQLEEFRMHSEHTISELRKQLLLCEADKERAVICKEQTQELLVQTKTALGEYHNKIDSLNSTISCLEEEKEALKNELMVVKASLQDSYQRLQIIDRGFSNDKYLEEALKSAKENHAEEKKNLENTISQMRIRLESSELEIKQLETKNRELHKEQEKMLINKADTVNELARKLQETQKQYQSLLMSSKSNVDVFEVHNLKKKSENMKMENDNSRQLLDKALILLEAISLENISSMQYNESENEADAEVEANLMKKSFEDDLNLSEDLFKMQNRLHKCIQLHKKNKNELKRLLQEREAQLNMLKEKETQALCYQEKSQKLQLELHQTNEKLADLESNMPKQNAMIVEMFQEKNALHEEYEKLEKENMTLHKKINDMEMLLNEKRCGDIVDKNSPLKRLSSLECSSESDGYGVKPSSNKLFENEEELKRLHKEIDSLKFQLSDSQREIDRYKTLYIELMVEKDKLLKDYTDYKKQDFVQNLDDMQTNVKRLEKELDLANKKICNLNEELIEKEKSEVKVNKVAVCSEHTDTIKKLEIECQKLHENCSVHKRDITDLTKQLFDASKTIQELEINLESRKRQDDMIEDMKQKAQKFEEFMKQNMSKLKSPVNSSNEIRNNNDNERESISVQDKCVSTDFNINLENFDSLHKNYQAEIIKCEQNVREELSKLFAEEIKTLVDKYKSEKSVLEDNLQKLFQTLQVRTKEVELLKNAILAERKSYSELLEEKNAILDEKAEEIERNAMKNYEHKLRICEDKIKTLMTTLDENAKMLQSERENNSTMKTELANENKHLKQQVESIEKSFTHMSEKYAKLKKCMENYKNYIADKEKHFSNEVERIKKGYDEAVIKMRNKMEKVIEKGEKKATERLKEIENQYQNKLASARSANSNWQ